MLCHGDCIAEMKKLPDNSIDSIVTDPPYELGFMGKSWDSTGIANSVEMWKECLRVLKPGGHLLSFGGTRTYHRMACAIEDAGFEVRDQIQWLYGSGFPKSMNIGKAVDKMQGNERVVIGKGNPMSSLGVMHDDNWKSDNSYSETKGNSKWEGWGTCLKPAHEPICLARKPISEKTIAENALKWGTGGLNIDACRIPTNETITNHSRGAESAISKGKYGDSKEQETHQTAGQKLGRFPANVILDEVAGAILDEQSGTDRGAAAPSSGATAGQLGKRGIYGSAKGVGWSDGSKSVFYSDKGGASRFFYCPKASKSERGEGNNHPTVKPLKLIEYLIKLITPPGGTVLDPFMGSGTTGLACINTGMRFVGIELHEHYHNISYGRIKEHTTSGMANQINL